MNETRAEYLPISKLHPFERHPFKVTDNEEMDQLVWSVLTQGLLTPLVVRPLENGEYEVISGHRRLHACKKAGIETVPALIYALNRDEATIAMVDSNLHREKILPSEKAFAYKMKRDALSHQGNALVKIPLCNKAFFNYGSGLLCQGEGNLPAVAFHKASLQEARSYKLFYMDGYKIFFDPFDIADILRSLIFRIVSQKHQNIK